MLRLQRVVLRLRNDAARQISASITLLRFTGVQLGQGSSFLNIPVSSSLYLKEVNG